MWCRQSKMRFEAENLNLSFFFFMNCWIYYGFIFQVSFGSA